MAKPPDRSDMTQGELFARVIARTAAQLGYADAALALSSAVISDMLHWGAVPDDLKPNAEAALLACRIAARSRG